MHDTPTRDLDTHVLARLSRDARARRELLWLRAMMKGDLRAARDFEALDPGLRRRLAPLVARRWHDQHARGAGAMRDSELYAELWDERFAHHAARYSGACCGCEECSSLSGNAG